MKVDPLNIGLIIVTLISALSAWAAQRASTKASMVNARSVAETEAYNRARKFDTDTIERQAKDYKDLEEAYERLEEKHKALKASIEEKS